MVMVSSVMLSEMMTTFWSSRSAENSRMRASGRSESKTTRIGKSGRCIPFFLSAFTVPIVLVTPSLFVTVSVTGQCGTGMGTCFSSCPIMYSPVRGRAGSTHSW